MADQKLSDLSVGAPNDASEMYIVNALSSFKSTLASLYIYIKGKLDTAGTDGDTTTVQVRRGSKVALGSITLASGEMYFTTDNEKEIYVGDGVSNILVGKVLLDVIANLPAAAERGRLFIATDTDDIYYDTGAVWTKAAISDISGTQDNLVSIDANGHPQDAGVTVDDTGTTTSELWTASKVAVAIANAVAGTSWKLPLESVNLIGNATIATLNGLTPSSGDCYVCTDAGTPTIGASDALVAGSVAEFDGTSWIELVTGSGGFVASGTRASLSTTTALIAPYTDATDDGKVVDFDGTSLTGTAGTDATDGNAIVVRLGVNSNNQYSFDGTVPTGSWNLINQGGGLFAGNGIDITSSVVSVKADAITGGDVQPVNLTADGAGLDVNAIAGTGIEADGSANLRLATQGNGITGGAGASLSVKPDAVGGANLATAVSVNTNGVAIKIDNVTIKENGSNQLYAVGGGGGGGLTWSKITGDTTALVGNGYAAVAATDLTLTLPIAPSVGDEVWFSDAALMASTYVLTIARNGQNIESLAKDIIIATNGATFGLVYVDASVGWKIIGGRILDDITQLQAWNFA